MAVLAEFLCCEVASWQASQLCRRPARVSWFSGYVLGEVGCESTLTKNEGEKMKKKISEPLPRVARACSHLHQLVLADLEEPKASFPPPNLVL